MTMSKVFIALEADEDTRPIIEAILIDNPLAVVNREPARHVLTLLEQLRRLRWTQKSQRKNWG